MDPSSNYNMWNNQQNTPPIQPPPSAGRAATTRSSTSQRHTTYKGIRLRHGKWVSEIREPRKTTRIWLGTYPTAEMAAIAYDVAAMALKGRNATLNFPDLASSYPTPASDSALDIRQSAADAAACFAPQDSSSVTNDQVGAYDCTGGYVPENEGSSSAPYFVDDYDEMFNMPNYLNDMAAGMLVNPPRLPGNDYDDDSPSDNYSGNDGLWSYFG